MGVFPGKFRDRRTDVVCTGYHLSIHSSIVPGEALMRLIRLLPLALAGLVTATLSADDWPQWRGPAGGAISAESRLPERWSDTQNIAWKSRLSGAGISTPIVWGDRVFVTSQAGAGQSRVGPRLGQGADATPRSDAYSLGVILFELCAGSLPHETFRYYFEQNVLYRWVRTESLEPFYQRLAAAGLNAPDALTLSDVISCPGAESCRLAVTQSRGLGRVLTEFFSARPDLVDLVPSGNIRISGCPNGCGQHHIGSLGFQGSVRKVGGKALPQYFVLVGGGVTDEGAHFGKVVAKIPARRITDAVDRLLTLYREERESDTEELGAFYRRIAPALATERLKDLVELRMEDTTAEDFIDLGESQAFDPIVMDGECSA